jgi:hypothetical protein
VIRQVEQYHGAVLARLLRFGEPEPINIGLHPDYHSVYVVESAVAIYVKYSTNRLTPWAFVFRPEHQDEIDELCCEFKEIFVALVCGTDGVACLSSAEYAHVLDGGSSASEWVRVSRKPRQSYTVTGCDGRRTCKIGNSEYPTKVYTAIS